MTTNAPECITPSLTLHSLLHEIKGGRAFWCDGRRITRFHFVLFPRRLCTFCQRGRLRNKSGGAAPAPGNYLLEGRTLISGWEIMRTGVRRGARGDEGNLHGREIDTPSSLSSR